MSTILFHWLMSGGSLDKISYTLDEANRKESLGLDILNGEGGGEEEAIET